MIDAAQAPAGATETGLEWVSRFEREHGRKLRVLHLGNIANNAYNNAKIQRRRGIDADVSCHDYYHIMGCPEWEDAEFEGDVVDDFYPDWWNVDLRGYRRPDWFAQGNWRTCSSYLGAQARRDRGAAARHGRRLTTERWLWCRSTRIARSLGYRGGLAHWLRLSGSVLRGVRRKIPQVVRAAGMLARGEGTRAAAVAVFPTRFAQLRPGGDVDRTPVARRFEARFPDHGPLRQNDLRGYRIQAERWAPVLREYDVVQGYAFDGILPLLCQTAAWAAYEHGTLREIPFEETPHGRVCALTYSEAPIVFVTNSDVLDSVQRLELDQRRVVYLPHAVDSDRLFRFADEHEHLAPAPGSPVTFYAPSRQDWVDGDVSWSKGSDRFLRAAALLRGRFDFRLVLAEWGRDLDATKRLLSELGLEERVEWVPPLRKRDLWTRYLASHAVVDQFAIRAIGGVAFEAMALGRRVVTALDTAQTERFFGRTPPLLAAENEHEIAAALERVLVDPQDGEGLGAAARRWFSEHHSADRIVELQANAYRRLLGEPTDASNA
ncbi:MAG: glycosyltransferase family 4 protein [Gaiellaceae bacterium]